MRKASIMTPVSFSREDVEAVQRLRQLYPPHVLASLFDDGNTSLLSSTRESVSSFSSGSVRSSVSSSPKTRNRNTGASFTSSIPATIDEKAVSPHIFAPQSFKAPSVHTVTSRSRGLQRSVSDYAIREHALNVRSFPQQVAASSPIYFCVHCGNGFEKRADWETHEWIFHERQSFWPCPQPGCQSFFDSGRAFEAHHQAVHGCGKCDHASRVVQLLPERKAWACGFIGCKEVFLDWSKRCKHVSNHYEILAKRQGSFRDSPEWTYSTTIRNLLRQPELRDPFKKFMSKCHGHTKASWPTLEWQPDKCAELQRCLEFRDFARGVPDIVHLAYRLGHPSYTPPSGVLSRPPSPPSSSYGPPKVSPRSSSLRRRERSRSVRSIMSHSTMSASSPHPSVSGSSFGYERKSSAPSRISDAPSFGSAPSILTQSPPHSPPTRDLSPSRLPNLFLAGTDLQRPSTATRKRMQAREPEVRGTTSMALLEFLRQGPPTVAAGGEHRARRIPRAIPPSPGNEPSTIESAFSSPTEEIPEPKSVMARQNSKHDDDFASMILPVTEEDHEQEHDIMNAAYTKSIEPASAIVLGIPQRKSKKEQRIGHERQNSKHETLRKEVEQEGLQNNNRTKGMHSPQNRLQAAHKKTQLEAQALSLVSAQDAEQDNRLRAVDETPAIQKTILEVRAPTYQFSWNGHKILPPTPGPPPTQLLPLPPQPAGQAPTITYLDTPNSDRSEGPPSPMPPGFTDISNWPIPPEAPASRSPTPPPLLPETPIIPTMLPSFSIKHPSVDLTNRPQTASTDHPPEVLPLIAPPKRARSASRPLPRTLRWVSIGTIIDPPEPSPGVDFGSVFSQPVDATQSNSPRSAINV